MGGGKGGSTTQVTERALTQQELNLLKTQEESLAQATAVATEQFNLSNEDRDYFEKIFRNPEEVSSEELQKKVDSIVSNSSISDDKKDEIKGLLTDSMSSGKSVDEMLFDAVKASSPLAKAQLDTWYETTAQLGSDYISETSGLSKTFADKLKTTSEEIKQGQYEFQSQAGRIQEIGSNMGKADSDIYAQTKGQNLAGISQAYAEAQKQLQGTMAQRGLTDSGVDINATTNLAQAEAMQKAQGLSNSYMSAIQQSDLRRQQQVELIGQESNLTNAGIGASQLQASLAGQEYQLGVGQSQLGYGVTSSLATSQLQNNLNASQQNIANLSQTSGISQGVYGGSQNYLNQAGNTANSTAGTAGQTAVGIGNMQTNYMGQQMSANAQAQAGQGALAGSLIGAVGAVGAGYFMGPASDIRFKNNIKFIKEIDGIKLYTWEWNSFAIDYGVELYKPYGVIAQELILTHPEFVFEDKNGYYVVDYNGIKKLIGDF